VTGVRKREREARRQFELHRSFSRGRPQKTQRHGVPGSAGRFSTQSQESPGGMNLSGLYFFTIFHEAFFGKTIQVR